MLQASKIIKSRDEWKCKAIQRGSVVRENRKYKKYAQEKIMLLEKKVRILEAAKESEKNSTSSPFAPRHLSK